MLWLIGDYFRLLNGLLRQILIYGTTGLVLNGVIFLAYLWLTEIYRSPKLTMSVLYLLGAIFSFLLNRRFTFSHHGSLGVTSLRYLVVQFIGYLLNLIILLLFVDWFNFSHVVIQGVSIFVVAIFLFVAMRFYVFQHVLISNEEVKY
jgi:putative flippase GtrA